MKKENLLAPRVLINSVRVLAAVGAVALASTKECEILFLVVFLSFFFLGMKIKDFPVLSRIMGTVQPFLAALMFVIGVLDFFYISNSFLLSVAHFLLSIQGLRLLVLRTDRENLGSILLSSMMMLSASTLAMDWTYFLLLVIFVAAVIWTLMLYTVLTESQLVAVSHGRPALQENTLLWRQMMPVMRWSTLTAFLLSAFCCALVFVTFPRFNFQGFRGQFLQPVRKTGFTGQVTLGKSGKIFTDDSVVMRVEIDPKDRKRWSGYLRGQALEIFDGRTWKNSPLPPAHAYNRGRGEINVPIQDERPGELLHQDIYLESMDSPLLFAAPRPVRILVDRPFVDIFPDGAVQRGNNDTWRIHYKVDSYLSQLDPAVKRKKTKSAVIPASSSNDSELLPGRTRSGTKAGIHDSNRLDPGFRRGDDLISNLAASISKNAGSDLEKAERIGSYLRNDFKYTLQLPPIKKERGPIEQFLFETKEGHCEYFASAMCLMLRSQGIPARMATGFLSRDWNNRGNYYMVRMKHAHAWVEADIVPYGWVGFDPSPREVSEGFSGTDRMRKFSDAMDYLNLRWNRYILSYDFERQVAIVKSFSQQSNQISMRLGRFAGPTQKLLDSLRTRWLSFSPDAEGKTPRMLKSFLLLAISAFSIVLLLAGLIWRFFHREVGVWFYPKLVRYLERKAGEKISHRTIREFVHTLGPKLGATAPNVDYLQAQYYRIRFDPTIRLTPADSDAIRSALKKL